MLLNFFDVDTSSGERSVELQVGDLPELGLAVDLLVVSAFEGDYEPVTGTLLGRLQEAYGLHLGEIEPALDLRNSPLKAWVSQPLVWSGAPGALSRFQRIVVIEGSIDWHEDQLLPWSPFNRLFSILALLPLRRIPCRTVATPLLGSGDQGIEPLLHFPDLLEAYREAFRHVPDLSRLILFGRTETHMRMLGDAIDACLGRSAPQSYRVELPDSLPGLDQLTSLLGQWNRPGGTRAGALAHDVGELIGLLRAEEIPPISLGIHARRVVEGLVLQSLAEEPEVVGRLNLYSGIRALQRRGTDPWVISCLHQVRCFGNWMGHPPRGGQPRPVQLADVLAMLSALQRVLEDYPWHD
ncbi:MAG: hypothetical protein ACKO5F_09580 [Synechococcus sp.]